MVRISNDKYTKNGFDSPFNKNLIGINRNQNPINLELIYLKEKSYDILRKKSPKEQIEILSQIRNQLKYEVDTLRNGRNADSI